MTNIPENACELMEKTTGPCREKIGVFNDISKIV